MRTAALHGNGMPRAEAAATAAAAPVRELTLSLSASAGLTAVIVGAGLVHGSDLCASAAVSWGLVGLGILGTHLASRNIPWGWLLLVSLQPIWIVYALATEQHGFIVGSIAYGLGQLNGFLRSRGATGPRQVGSCGEPSSLGIRGRSDPPRSSRIGS